MGECGKDCGTPCATRLYLPQEGGISQELYYRFTGTKKDVKKCKDCEKTLDSDAQCVILLM